MTGDRRRFETRAVSAGERFGAADERRGRDVISPIHLSTTYTWDALDRLEKDEIDYEYSRIDNPTRASLEAAVARLEGADHALAFASGMAAISSAVLALAEPGGHVVAFENLYSGTERMLTELADDHLGVEVDYVDARDPANVEAAIRPETDLLWLETPTNPLMHLCDIEANAELAHEHGVPVGVDNTFLSPYFQNPLDLGADFVAHSTTKFLNGHSDAVGGALVTDDEALHERFAFVQRIGLGNMLSPFNAYMVLRGIKTLPLRIERQAENAARIARFLEGRERIRRVRYPGLESHPQHDLARRQASGFGGVLSFEFDGTVAETEAFLRGLDEFHLAVSLGSVESLVELPARMTHDETAGGASDIPDTLVRMSVGVEHVEDLLEDVESALP